MATQESLTKITCPACCVTTLG